MANRFIIEIRTKGFKGAEKDLDKIKKKTDEYSEAGKKMRLTTQGMRKSIGILRNNLLLVTFAFGGLMAAVNKTVGAYRQQIEAETKLRRSLANVASASSDGADKLIQLAAALQKVTTFGDEQIIAGQAMLATFQLNEDAIAALTPRMIDMAAATEKDMVSAAMLLGKAFTGQVSALSEAGIIIDKVGITSARSAGPVREFAFLAGELDKNFQGVAEALAGTDIGKIDQMTNAISDLNEEMGKSTLPLQKLAVQMKKGVLESLSMWVMFFKEWSNLSEGNIKDLTKMGKAWENVFKGMEELKKDADPTFGTPETLTTLEKTIAGIKEQALIWKLLGIEAGNTISVVTNLTEKEIQQHAGMNSLYKQRMALQGELTAQSRINSATVQAGQEVTIANSVKYAELQIKIKANAMAIHEAEMKGTADMFKAFSALAGQNKEMAIASARLAQAAALIDMYAGANKAFAQGGVLGFVTGAAVIAQGLANVAQIENSLSQMQSAATGADFVTDGPQMVMVGDNPGGRERVQVTPIGSPNIEGPQGGITVNISAPLVDETVIDTIIPAIQKAQRLNLA